MMNQQKEETKWFAAGSLFRQFFIFFIPLFVLAAIIFGLFDYLLTRHDRALIFASQQTKITLARKSIAREFRTITADLHFLSHSSLLQIFLDSPQNTSRQMVEAKLKNLTISRRLYDQVRFLDSNGMENIRINYNGGQATTVPAHELQDKSKRYYFLDAIKLDRNEVFVSPFDLNIENGKVEYPLKPMIRFSTPVFDRNNHKRGVIILNYMGDILLTQIKELISSGSNSSPMPQNSDGYGMLLNQEGYFLLARQRSDEWGFMLNKEITFANHFPDEWQILNDSESGQFMTGNGVFTFTTIYPLEEGQISSNGSPQAFKASTAGVNSQGYYWKLISYVDHNHLVLLEKQHRNLLFLFFSLFTVFISVSCWLMARTRLQKMQALLLNEQNEEKFRTMADFSYDWEEWLAPDGDYAYISPSCKSLTGYSDKEFYSDPELLLKILHPDDKEMVIQHQSRHLRLEAETDELEFRIITKSGQIRWIWHHCRPVFKQDGTWTGRRIANRDITDKHNAESVLQQERDMFLQGPVVTFSWINSENWPVEHVSGNVFDVLGYPGKAFLEGSIKYASIIHQDDLDRVTDEVITHSSNDTSSFTHEPYRLITPTGDTVWVLDTTTIIRNDQGEITHYLGYLVDISEQKRQEAIVLESAMQKEQLNHLDSMKTMAGAIAHRFNNAMTAVQGNLDLMTLMLDDDSNEHKMASDAAQAARGASQVGSMMLSYVGQRPLQRQNVSLSDLAMKSITALKRCFQPSISLNFTPPETPLYCSVDPLQIQEVIESIVCNAVESLEGKAGTIEISFGAEKCLVSAFPIPFQSDNVKNGMYCFCQVKDTGHGISPEILPRIFEPFYTTRFVGRGLGLALTVGIMQAHHGAVIIESSMDKGTNAKILLPSQDPLSQQALVSSDEMNKWTVRLSGTILLVDDEEMVLEVGRKNLEMLGFTVHTAVNGREAVEKVSRQANSYSAVLLDISMPEMDGIEAMQAIRKIRPALPIVLSSGYSEDDFPFQEGQEDRPDGFLGKPFQLSDMRSILEKILF